MACAVNIPNSAANPPVDMFGGILNQMIQQDMQQRARREEQRRERQAQAVLVRRLQIALRQLGYYRGDIDGDFGSGTQAAVAAYQRDRGLPITSNLNEYDLAEIEAAARNKQGQGYQQQPSAPTPVPAYDPPASEPPVNYSSVTPEDAWKNYRFTQASLSQPGPYKPSGDSGWLTVASASDFQNVVGAAVNYAQDYPSTAIIKSNNGRFAIVIGWMPKTTGKKLLEVLKSEGVIPSDSYVSSGQRYIGPVWTASTEVRTRTDLLRYGFLRASPHMWDRLLKGAGNAGFGEFRSRVSGVAATDDDKAYLSLRKTADVSGEEVARMPEGTLLAVRETSGGWSRVRLLDGREGWASNKYIALNDDTLNGRSPTPSQPETTPYGDKDLQDRLVSNGTVLMQDIGLFLKANPNVPGVTAIVEAVSQLNSALSSRDYQTIESTTSSLRQLLAQNDAYKLFATQREEQRRQEEERQKAEAIALANRNIFFLRAYVPANVTASFIGELNGLLKEYEAATGTPVHATLDDINSRLAAAVDRNDLAAQYTRILQGYVAPAAQPSPGSQAAVPDAEEQSQQQLKDIAEKAQDLLKLVSRFSDNGKTVADPIKAARLIVALKASIKAADATAIMRDQKALEEFLAKDQIFSAFAEAERATETLKQQQERDAAEAEARRLIAFIEDYIKQNFASDKLDILIAAQDKLRASLQGGNGPDVFSTVTAATQMIANAGLKLDLDAFRLADPAQESELLVKCRSVAQIGSWQDALAQCEAALAEQPANAEIVALVDKLRQQQRSSEELDVAKTRATALLDQLRSFAESDRTLADPLAVARLASALRDVVDGGDAARILAAANALDQSLTQDPGFRTYRQQQEQQQSGLNDEMRQKQGAEASRIRAFIAQYVADNVADAGVGRLLQADAALEAAVASQDSNNMLKANDAARTVITEMGAAQQLEGFTVPATPIAGREEAIATFDMLDAFARDGKTLAQPLKVAALVAALRRSLEGTDGATVAAAVGALEGELATDPQFTAFSKAYREGAQREAFDRVAGLRNEAARIKAFLEQRISSNVSSADVPRLLELSSILGEADANGDATRLQSAMTAATETIGDLGLREALAAFSLAPQQPEASVEATSNELVVNDANRALLTGDDADLLVLFNNSGKAKGVRRDLLGKLVFGDVVSVCWYHDQPQADLASRMAFADLVGRGGSGLSVAGVCKAEELPSADLVMLQRGAFLATDRAYAKAFADLFANGTFQLVNTVRGSEVTARAQADNQAAQQIEADAEAGRRDGFGIIRFTGDAKSLCMIPGPMTEALTEAVHGMRHPLAGALPGWSLRDMASPDEAFAAVRKGDCGALLLAQGGMAQVIAAARRENVDFEVMPLWLGGTQMKELQSRIDADKAARKEAEEIRRRQLDDAAKEEAARREKLGEIKAQQEAALRSQYESLAEGLAADASDQLRAFVAAPDLPENAAIAAVFPDFARWYRDQVNAGWELQSDGFTTDLADYGTVRWQDRTLDTVFFQLSIGMNNRELGKYQSKCFLLGAVVDKEFRRYRDVFETDCGEAEPGLSNWKDSHGFAGRWIVK